MKSHVVQKQPLSETIKTTSAAVALVLTLGSVVASIFTFATAYQLQPVAKDISEIKRNVQAEHEANADDIGRAEFEATVKRIDTNLQTITTDLNIIKENLVKKGLQ